MDVQDILKFLEERPQLSIYGLAKESKVCASTFDKVLKGNRAYTDCMKMIYESSVYPVMKKYGYSGSLKSK